MCKFLRVSGGWLKWTASRFWMEFLKARWNLLEARDFTTYIKELPLLREPMAEFKHALIHMAMDVRGKAEVF